MIAEHGVIHRDGPDLAWYRWTSPRAGEVTATRRSVVLAHGITYCAACWTRIAGYLTDELSVEVIGVDARGHGRSDRATDYSFTAGVDDLTEACAVLGLERPVLVGHSMGGPHVTAAAPEVQAVAVAVSDPHWPLHPQDDTTYDVGAWERDFARDTATNLRDPVREGRLAHPGWREEDLTAWVVAKREADPAVTSWVSDQSPSTPGVRRWRV